MKYNDSIDVLKGIGEKTKKAFKKIGIETVQDLLEHYPRGYEEFGMPVPISQITEGDTVTIEASLTGSPTIKKVRNLQIINAEVRDASGTLALTWFNMPYLMSKLRTGSRYLFRGKIKVKYGRPVMEQPKIYFNKDEYYRLLKVLQPVYPLTEGITNNLLIKSVRQILENLDFARDYIPKK